MFKPSACRSINSLENVILGPVEFGTWWQGVDDCVGKPPPVFFISFLLLAASNVEAISLGFCVPISYHNRDMKIQIVISYFSFSNLFFPWQASDCFFEHFLSVKFLLVLAFWTTSCYICKHLQRLPVSFVVLCSGPLNQTCCSSQPTSKHENVFQERYWVLCLASLILQMKEYLTDCCTWFKYVSE